MNYQNTPVNSGNRALSPYINKWKSARRLLQSQIIQVASWPDWLSIGTCCYRNAMTGITALSNVLKASGTVDIISIGYTYTNYYQCAREIPSSPNSIQTSSILLHLYFEQAWCTVRICLFPWKANSLVFPFSPPLQQYTPFPGALCPPWHGAVPGSLQGAPRNISSGAPRSLPPSPRTNHKQNLQWRKAVVQLTKSGRESLYNRAA